MSKASTPERQQQFAALRARFYDGEPLPAALLPGPVARSWARSREGGLRPSQAPFYDLPGNTRESPADRRLLRAIAPEIEQLCAAFGGTNWTIFCANPQGMVIHARRSADCHDDKLLPIIAGRRILESYIGTTAPSCALHDATETVVAPNQHYLDEFAQVFCLAVPLFGFDGEVIGALDITGTGQRSAAQMREPFRHAALAAEQRLYATLRDSHLLHLHHDPRWLGTPLAGLLAVDDGGQVRAATRLARRMLALPQQVALPATLDLDLLFADAAPAQRRRLLQPIRTAQRVLRPDGSHLWVQHARAPLARPLPRATSVDASAVSALSAPSALSTLSDALAHGKVGLGEPAGSVEPGTAAVRVSSDKRPADAPAVLTPGRPMRRRTAAAAAQHGTAQANTPAAPADISLHEQSLLAIRRTVDEHDGNIAAAARQLGISRTTVYAKLRQFEQAGIVTGTDH